MFAPYLLQQGLYYKNPTMIGRLLHNLNFKRITFCLAASGSVLFSCAQHNPPARVSGLQCEYLFNPLGIDSRHPRLSWKLDDQRQGARQTAYQLLVSTDSAV